MKHQALVVSLLALGVSAVVPVTPARAFFCGGGGDWRESDGGGLCQLAEGDPGSPEARRELPAMDAFIADREMPRRWRARVAGARCEISLAHGLWADADRTCQLAGRLARDEADANVGANRTVALFRLGRRDEARTMADRYAQRVCDSTRGDASDDQAVSCPRAYAVLRATDVAAASAREAHFRELNAEAYAAEAQRASCLVSGTAPCHR